MSASSIQFTGVLLCWDPVGRAQGMAKRRRQPNKPKHANVHAAARKKETPVE
jgi:hypothetical protein